MKTIQFLVAATFLFAIFPMGSYSQIGNATRTFKIVGKTKLTTLHGEKTVEYDPESPNHLYITDFGKNGTIVSKRQFLFKGKKFDLSVNYMEYHDKKEIFIDGFHSFYNTDGSIIKSLEYKNDSLLRQYKFYSNGQKQSMVPGISPLNGEYQMWYSNGQLSFSGYYKDDLKNGNFEMFDESGTSIKKGAYEKGKLISGEAVVPDIIYNNPEKKAQYINDNEDFEGFLKRRSTEIGGLKEMKNEKRMKLNLTINKSGIITKMETQSTLGQPELEFLNAVFKEKPAFSPATVEDLPVESILTLPLALSNEGIKTDTDTKQLNLSEIFTFAEKMPQFPGGGDALRKFISSNLKYPLEAQKSRIEGKVFVSFVVDENGEVTNIKLARGIDYYLDCEALRVVRLIPRWEPGFEKGKPVKVSYTVPIDFHLTNNGFN